MSYTTATFSDVTYLDQRLLPQGNLRPALRGAMVIGLGTVAAAGVVGAMAAASMMLGSPRTGVNPAAQAPVPSRAAVIAQARRASAPSPAHLRSAPSLRTMKDVNWAALISDPNPFATPSHFELDSTVAAAPQAAPPAPVVTRAEPAAPVAPVIAPLPPVMARADFETAPDAGNSVIAPLPPVIARTTAAPEPPAEAAPLPSVMVHSEPIPLPPRRPATIASREIASFEPAARPEAVPPTVVKPAREAVQPAPVAAPRHATSARAVAAPAQEDDRYPLQRFFSALTSPFRSGSRPVAGSGAAVYDIAAHTVYLPDGERLEAHSGLGHNFDNPRSATEKNRGVTPPNVYQLSLRPKLFHGVAALRLTPTNEGLMHGRVGMLAHTYMLGPRGDSNGCVSFRDYRKFLHAFQSGQISRLVVVSRAGSAPYSVASNNR